MYISKSFFDIPREKGLFNKSPRANFCSHRSCGGGDITFLIFVKTPHVTT